MAISLDAFRSATDHFSAFGLPRKFGIDPAELEKRYMELTRLTHPDVAGDEAEAQLEALDLSARLNDAHRVLAGEESRANYLLGLLGGPGADADKSLPEGFLPIIMMTREELAEAQLEGDEERIGHIETDAKAHRAARVAELARQLDMAATAPTPELLKAIRTELNALRYYERLLEQVHPDGML